MVGAEPLSAGGDGLGPSPIDLLIAALAECTAMTVRWLARQQRWSLDQVEVVVDHARNPVLSGSAPVDAFEKTVFVHGPLLDERQRARLMEVARRCPVQRVLPLLL